MKKLFLLMFTMSLTFLETQAIQISYNVSNYQGGNNISCHGATDGWINIVVVDGTLPYYFTWSNGAYTQNLNNLAADNYTVTVTDATGITASTIISLRQPNALSVNLNPRVYDGGYNISSQGGQDGIIETDISGGTRDYTYQWSTGSNENKITDLTAGTYSLNVTDMNGCSASSATTLIEPTALHVANITSPSHNGYNISCYEGRDGAINLNVTGGVPPYSYHWSNGSELQNISGLYTGHYSVTIQDASGGIIAAQIDLSQPTQLRISNITPYIYGNGYNLSCSSCSKGSLTVNTTGGVSPLAFLWESGQTSNPLTGIGAGVYYVTVTDINGCSVSSSKTINPPPVDAWSLNGNSTTTNTQYLGTSDNKPVVLKTNNTERVRFNENGEIQFKGPVEFGQVSVTQPLQIDTLKIGRIMALDGDSIIRIGLGSVSWNQNANRMYATPSTVYPAVKGMAIGDNINSWGLGVNSYALGNHVRAEADYSIAIGNDVKARASGVIAIGSGFNFASTLDNNLVNSIMLGTKSSIPTVFISPSATAAGTGNVGIGGTTAPTEKLEIAYGNTVIRGITNFTSPGQDAYLFLGNSNYYIKSTNGYGLKMGFSSYTDFVRITSVNNHGVVAIDIDPLTALANNNTNYKLLVGGSIGANEIWVSTGNPSWPDYVFNKDYKLMSLKNIKEFIIQNKHLPNIPAAETVNKTNSVNLGDIQIKILQHVEELYLHVIQLNDKIEKLESQNKLLLDNINDSK